MDPESSPALEVDLDAKAPESSAGEQTESTTKADVAVSESSTEKTGSMLDAVKAAVAPKADPPAAPDKDAPAEADAPATTDAKDKAEEFSPEEFAQLSAKTQSRLKRLNSESKLQRAEIERLAPKAKEFDAIENFVSNAGLTQNDVKSTLEIAALAVSNPRQALDRIMVVVRNLEKVVGEQLPPELQQRVDAGYLTVEDAKALSRSNAEAALANKRATQIQEQQRVNEAVQTQQAETNKTLASVDVWEKAKLKSDPDFHLKRKDVAELVELAILQESNRQGRPYFPNPEEAVKMSETALKTVTERYSRFTPKPVEIRPINGGASARSTAEPKTFMDAIRNAAAA